MMHPLTFPRGGITLPLHDRESRCAPMANAAMPPLAVVPMPRHGPSAVVCLVRPGDRVDEGQLIGRPGGPHSAPVHAPIPGIVAAVREARFHDGTRGPAAAIELGGTFAQSGRPLLARDWTGWGPERILELIRDAGIALDGSCGPLAARLAAARSRSAAVLVANAVESQPWLAAESRLLVERPADVAEALRIVQSLLGSPRLVLAVAADAAPAAKAVSAASAAGGAGLEVVLFDARYPQEEDSRIAAALLGCVPPPGGTALDLGVAVVRVSSLVAVRDAVVLGKPCFERVVTVGGPALRAPRNLKVRFGTRAGDLLEETGGLAASPAAVVFGSLMQGSAMTAAAGWEQIPMTRDVSALLFLDHDSVPRGKVRPCLRCGRCLEVCPWGLAPVRLHELAGSGALARAAAEGLASCTGCGCCSYECPSRIPLADGLRAARAAMEGGAA